MDFKELLDISSKSATIILAVFLVIFGISYLWYDDHADFDLKCNAAGGIVPTAEKLCLRKEAIIEIE